MKIILSSCGKPPKSINTNFKIPKEDIVGRNKDNAKQNLSQD